MPHYENVPFEIPNGWEWVTIGRLSSFLSRGKSPKYSEERKYPVFAQKCNLYDGDISLEQARFLDPETISKWSDEYKLIDGDILVNSTGTGTVGRTRLFHSDILGDYPFVVPDSHVSVVRTLEEVESKFVLAFLSSDYGQTYIEDNLAGSTNQKELYIGILDNMQFPLPPHEEQLRIVTAVDKWFALIDTIEQGQADLQTAIKQTKSKILDLAIHGKLVPQDPNDEPASELLKRINPKAQITSDNEYNKKLPKGWAMLKVKDAFTTNPKNKVDNRTNAGFVPMAYIDEGYSGRFKYDVKQWNDIKSGFTHFANGDIAVAKISPCLENLKSIVLTNLPNGVGAGTTELHVFRALYTSSKYSLYFFKSCFFIQKCVSTFNGVVGQQRVGKSIIENIDFPIPPLVEQQRIINKVEELFSSLDAIKKSLKA
jgi:type I restriction enzyme ecoR124II specificity protein (fragment)